MAIGFIGLGKMGFPIAKRLVDGGFDLTVFDVRPEAAEPLVAAGAHLATSPAEVARDCRVVFGSLPDADTLAAVALGADGVASTAQAGDLFVSLSTIAPADTRAIAAGLAEHEIDMLEAPVSGSIHGAREGTLVVAVGGDPAFLERVRPEIDAFASTVIHAGALGAGGIAKIAHNMVNTINNWAIVEGLTVAAKAGIEPEVMLEMLRAGSYGRHRSLHGAIPSRVLTADYSTPDGTLGQAVEVMALGADLAREHGVPVPLHGLITQQMIAGLNRGWGELDARSALQIQEERAGIRLRDGAAKGA